MADTLGSRRHGAPGFVNAVSTVMQRPIVERVAWRVLFGVALALSAHWIIGFYAPDSGRFLFIDAHIYYRATDAWLHGSNPWMTTYLGVPFAGIPPTLLLNLPLIPFGESVAVAFWVLANSVAVVLLVWRLRLPIWVLFLLPIVEGWLAATPDLALAGSIVVGAGWLAALTKPYSAPSLISERRWAQLGMAAIVGIVTIPLLPWMLFYESRAIVAEAFANFAGNPVSAAGNPFLITVVVIALASLGWKRGWALFTPGLLAQQSHYIVFSLETVTRSRILSLAMTIPMAHAAAVGVIAYAAVDWWRSREQEPTLTRRPDTA